MNEESELPPFGDLEESQSQGLLELVRKQRGEWKDRADYLQRQLTEERKEREDANGVFVATMEENIKMKREIEVLSHRVEELKSPWVLISNGRPTEQTVEGKSNLVLWKTKDDRIDHVRYTRIQV